MARTQMTIGEDGKVDVWDAESKEKLRRYPIDAKELIANGNGRYSLGGPTLRMIGDAGEVMVDEEDAAMYLAKGYKMSKDGETVKGDGDGVDKPKDGEDDAPYDFTKHNKAELQAFANEAKIDAGGMNREKLIEALDKAGFKPAAKH